MKRRRHPPMPSSLRPLFWVLRVFGLIVGVGGVLAALGAATQGLWSTAFAAVAAGVGFMALTWIHPQSRWFVPILASLGLLAAIGQGSWATGVTMAGVVALMLWLRWRPSGGRGARVDPDKITICEPDAVMRNARGFVDQFAVSGFEQVGALRIAFGPIEVILSLLLSSDGHSYAAVTDAILNVTSLFPGGRALVTRNSDHTVLPDYILTNNCPGATPTELVESHSRALALLSEGDHYPVPVAAAELPQIAIEGERAAIDWASAHRHLTRGVDGDGQLCDRPNGYREIDAWYRAGLADPEA